MAIYRSIKAKLWYVAITTVLFGTLAVTVVGLLDSPGSESMVGALLIGGSVSTIGELILRDPAGAGLSGGRSQPDAHCSSGRRTGRRPAEFTQVKKEPGAPDEIPSERPKAFHAELQPGVGVKGARNSREAKNQTGESRPKNIPRA